MDDELRRIAHRAAGGPPGPSDLADVRARVRTRRRRHVVVTSTAAVVAIVAGTFGLTQLREPARVEVVQQGATELVSLDTVEPTLPRGAPAGYMVCDPPSTDGAVTTARLCGEGGTILVTSGPHAALDEVGRPFPLGPRTGYVQRTDDALQVTVSDSTSSQDRHWRLATDDPAVTAGDLAEMIGTIPAYRAVVSE